MSNKKEKDQNKGRKELGKRDDHDILRQTRENSTLKK
jgi:hypothetical protein